MTTFEMTKQFPGGLVSELDLHGIKASWIGEYPPGHGIAIGGDDGRVVLVNKGGAIAGQQSSESDEAINGLAFLSGWIGISTRANLRFVDLTPASAPMYVPVPYGAHGVIAGPNGHFVAPLGTNGLLTSKPSRGNDQPFGIRRSRNEDLNCYRVIALNGPNSEPVLAIATRRDGITATPFDSTERDVHSLTFDGFDAIDLCPLTESSLAVASLGKDGTILLCRDVVEETRKRKGSITVRFPDIRGTAYRILNAADNLIVITSQAIYFLGQLGTNFLHEKAAPITMLDFPIKAIDANIVNEHWLMIVTSRGVLQLDLRRLDWNGQQSNGHQHRVTELIPLFPEFKGREVQLAA